MTPFGRWKKHPGEVKVGELHAYIDRMVQREDDVAHNVGRATKEALDLSDEYFLERGVRPSPFAIQQRGLEDDFEKWVYEREARERAAREAEYEAQAAAESEVRRARRVSGEREMRERRAEQLARRDLARLGLVQHDDSTYRR